MNIVNRDKFVNNSYVEGLHAACGNIVFRTRTSNCAWCGERACVFCARRTKNLGFVFVCDNPKCKEIDKKAGEWMEDGR